MSDCAFISAPRGPQRIVCLTEETTEFLYAIGEQHRIVGAAREAPHQCLHQRQDRQDSGVEA
jgi:ABC-type hemin transport system substrate-binding protein